MTVMPVYELLGGRLRGAVPVYVHASGPTIEATVERAAELYAGGYRHLRPQTGQPGRGGGYGAGGVGGGFPDAPNPPIRRMPMVGRAGQSGVEQAVP
jgi:mannonate dehydratase